MKTIFFRRGLSSFAKGYGGQARMDTDEKGRISLSAPIRAIRGKI
jgi:hypothetical protein